MGANSQDAWYRPVTDTGVEEARWVRAIEIRPTTLKGRKITHHAVARLRQDDGFDDAAARATRGSDAAGTPGLFMEWAVGKQGEIARPNTGKLMLPGSKIVWDIHYHAVGEAITDSVELAIYFYPKGQEPKYRQVLGQFDAITGGRQNLDIPPNSVAVHQAFHVMKQAGRIENFQPHMHFRGKAMSMEAILPDGTTQMLSHANFQFNWHLNYIYAEDEAPLLPQGHRAAHHRVARQHRRQQEQPGSQSVGGLGRSHRRRDGARLGQRHLHERRGLRQGSRGTQGEADGQSEQRRPQVVPSMR